MRSHRDPIRSSTDAGGLLQGRSAFTLLELLLVLSVLVIMATLSWPRLMKTIRQQGVQGNAEQVRQVLDQARVRAVEEGRTLQFRFEPQGKRYVLLPLDPKDEMQSSSGLSTTTQFRQQPVKSDPFRVYTVNQNCFFHVDSALLSGERTVSERLGDAWTDQLENPSEAQDAAWSAPILYYPDGSATDATLVVMDAQRHYIKIHVRGLTGAVWSEPLAVMAERLGRTGN